MNEVVKAVDEWVKATGAVAWNSSWHSELQSMVEQAFKSGQARAALAATPAAAPVELPEHWGVCVGGRIWIGKTPEHVLKLAEQEGMNPTLLFTEQQVRALLATATAPTEPFGYFKAEPFGWTDSGPDDEGAVALYEKPQAMLATGGQAQAVERGEVLVTVSGFTGSGKSAIAGEIEILCRALGLQVEWPDGESEKNMTHADWTAALEQYKPRVRIVEQNIPFASKKGLSE